MRIMLTVGVDLYRVRISGHLGRAQTCKDRGTFAQIVGMSKDLNQIALAFQVSQRLACNLIAAIVDQECFYSKWCQLGSQCRCANTMVIHRYNDTGPKTRGVMPDIGQ